MSDCLTRQKNIVLLFFLFLFFHFGNLNAQDKYNLEFRSIVDFKWFTNVNLIIRVDSSVLIHNKYPMVLEQEKNNPFPVLGLPLLTPDIRQTFLLPDSLKNACIEISINNKCFNMERLLLRVIGLNECQEITFSDSTNINNVEQWTEKLLELKLRDTKFLIVGIDGYSPNIQKKSSKLYLDRIKIQLNDQPIEEIASINKLDLYKPIESYCGLLATDSINTNFIKKTILPNKRIIALGETVHGSTEIAECVFNIIKENILYNNCRCVMIEEDMSMLLKMNLFVNERLSEKSLEEIEKDMNGIHINTNALLHFLSWLRKYNHEMPNNKVHLWGIEPRLSFARNALFDYFYAFYNVEYRNIFSQMLECLKSVNYKQAFVLATTQSATLIDIMGKDEYEKFLYVLDFQNQLENESQNAVDGYLSVRKRENYMFENVDYFLRHNLQRNEKVIIYTHYGHAQKKAQLRTIFPVIFPLGYYLNQKYKDSYGVVGITIGEGEITTRSNEAQDEFISYKVAPSSASSLEKLLMDVKKEYIYCPSQCLPNDIYLIRYIGNRVWKEQPDIYNVVKECADGFVFIRQSHGFVNGKFDLNYLYKYTRRRRILQQIQKENNLIDYEDKNRPLGRDL